MVGEEDIYIREEEQKEKTFEVWRHPYRAGYQLRASRLTPPHIQPPPAIYAPSANTLGLPTPSCLWFTVEGLVENTFRPFLIAFGHGRTPLRVTSSERNDECEEHVAYLVKGVKLHTFDRLKDMAYPANVRSAGLGATSSKTFVKVAMSLRDN